MTILRDIRQGVAAVIDQVGREIGQPLSPAAARFARAQRLEVVVGRAAAQAIRAETGDAILPTQIDDVPLSLTDAFPGFEVVIL